MQCNVCSDTTEQREEVVPAVFPLTVQVFSTIPVALHAVGGDDGPLDIGARLYVSSYYRWSLKITGNKIAAVIYLFTLQLLEKKSWIQFSCWMIFRYIETNVGNLPLFFFGSVGFLIGSKLCFKNVFCFSWISLCPICFSFGLGEIITNCLHVLFHWERNKYLLLNLQHTILIVHVSI